MNEEKMDALKEAIRKANEPETIMIPAGGIDEVSDGYHTFNELYLHRNTLFAVLCNAYRTDAWKSMRHADGYMYDDYFIAGIKTPAGMVAYHIELLHWDLFDVPELERAPEYDGHTSADVLDRLPSLHQPKVRARTEKPEGHMDFGEAIRALKAGLKVARAGWNGRVMYLWLKPATEVKREWCRDPYLIEAIDRNGGESIAALGTICMFTHDSTGRKAVLTGWIPSQSDMLYEDWYVVG
jgi:hypothetical protein